MLVCLTGIDGCGKTSQIKLLAEALEALGRSVYVSKALTDDLKRTTGDWLRRWDDVAITFLFQAFHAQQRAIAEEYISKDYIVLADRWDESFLAYHSLHGNLSKDDPLRSALNEMAFQGIVPDLTFLLLVSSASAESRRSARAFSDVFDNRDLKYFEMIQCEYERLAKERSWIIVDASRSKSEVHSEIFSAIKPLLH